LTNPQHAIIRIPYQKIHLDLVIEIEHPLKIPCEFIQNESSFKEVFEKPMDKFNPSLGRLVTLSNILSQKKVGLVKKIPVSITVVRDLLNGEFWPQRELNMEFDATNTYSNVEVEKRIRPKTLDHEQLSEIIDPAKSYLARLSGLKRDTVAKQTHLVNHTIQAVEHVATKVRLIASTSGRKQWIHDNGPFRNLVTEIIDTVPGFEPILPPIQPTETEYPYAPEIQALLLLRNTRDFKEIIKLAKEICKTLPSQIQNEQSSRLESIQTLVGSARDMWDAAIQVLNTSETTGLILSSFTNSYNFDFTVEQIQKVAAESSLAQLCISIGEPDRTSGMEHIEKSRDYLQRLENKLSTKLQIFSGVSPTPNHVKMVVSDTGRTLFTSSNLLSSSPENFVLESGIIINDIELARNLIEILIEESWVPRHFVSQVSKMDQDLSQQEYPKQDTSILEEKLEKTLQGLNSKGSKKKFALIALENQLQKIAERPRYTIILNEKHRSVIQDSTSRFSERLILASDGLRESGLDKATINSIKRRAKTIKTQKGTKPIIQIWWGRHAPGSKAIDDQDQRGREQAKERLILLRTTNSDFWFYPQNSNEPMETHSKIILIDDLRLFFTSDNFLAYGDPEFYQGDSGELGIIIDHPRVARQIRGQMELWLPEARTEADITRWSSALSDEIYYQSYSRHTSIPLENPITELMMRILEDNSLQEDWNRQFNTVTNQKTIQQIVDNSWNNGRIIGLFHLSGPGSGNFRSITVEQTRVSLSGDPIWREYTDEEKEYNTLMKRKQETKLKEQAKQYPLSTQEFSDALISEMRKPHEWHAFASVYGKAIQKNHRFNLKLRNIKPTKYLETCTEFLEIKKRSQYPWIWIRRRI
jgi:hypothetical protein